MNTNELKGYLKRVYELESSLYMQASAYHTVNAQIQQLRNPVKMNYYGYERDDRDGSVGRILIPIGMVAGVIIGFQIWIGEFGFFKAIGLGLLVGLAWAVGIVSLQYFVRGADLKAAKKAVDRRNQEIDNQKRALEERNNAQADILQHQLSKINAEYWETKEVLDTYYNKGIIYSKYQNFVAVSSIYEYIDSGRCASLEGHEGAYNLYETEVRMNLIITKLTDISQKLDRIIDNQRALYHAISACNKQVTRLSNNMMKSLNNIENNAEVSNYYNRISAQNTEFIKWINVLKC